MNKSKVYKRSTDGYFMTTIPMNIAKRAGIVGGEKMHWAFICDGDRVSLAIKVERKGGGT